MIQSSRDFLINLIHERNRLLETVYQINSLLELYLDTSEGFEADEDLVNEKTQLDEYSLTDEQKDEKYNGTSDLVKKRRDLLLKIIKESDKALFVTDIVEMGEHTYFEVSNDINVLIKEDRVLSHNYFNKKTSKKARLFYIHAKQLEKALIDNDKNNFESKHKAEILSFLTKKGTPASLNGIMNGLSMNQELCEFALQGLLNSTLIKKENDKYSILK